MTVNDATLNLITEFEGFIDHWYADPALGWKVPTAMYGHTNATGNPPVYSSAADRKLKFTKAEAIATLKLDLQRYEKAVDSVVTVPLNANQRGALVSFTFNLGEGNLKKSTLLKKVNAKDWAGAAAEFAKWNKAGGKVMAGLTRRRKAESELFLTPAQAIPKPIPAPKPTEPQTPASEAPTGFRPDWGKIGIAGVILLALLWGATKLFGG